MRFSSVKRKRGEQGEGLEVRLGGYRGWFLPVRRKNEHGQSRMEVCRSLSHCSGIEVVFWCYW